VRSQHCAGGGSGYGTGSGSAGKRLQWSASHVHQHAKSHAFRPCCVCALVAVLIQIVVSVTGTRLAVLFTVGRLLLHCYCWPLYVLSGSASNTLLRHHTLFGGSEDELTSALSATSLHVLQVLDSTTWEVEVDSSTLEVRVDSTTWVVKVANST